MQGRATLNAMETNSSEDHFAENVTLICAKIILGVR